MLFPRRNLVTEAVLRQFCDNVALRCQQQNVRFDPRRMRMIAAGLPRRMTRDQITGLIDPNSETVSNIAATLMRAEPA